MKSYKIMRLVNNYNFKQTNNQLIFEHFDGTNIKTISKWKVGLNCNIESVRGFILFNLIKVSPDDPKLIDYIDGLEYKDSIIG